RIADRATVVVQGECSLDLLSDMRLRLDAGRLTATADEGVVGFTVETPDAYVKDIGTRFGVAVSSAGSDIVVFDGEVEVSAVDSAVKKGPTRLTAGEAVRWRENRLPERISSVVSEGESEEWTAVPDELADGAIATVTDNVESRSSYHFYPVLRKGMNEGVLAWPYETNKPRWWSVSGEGLPAELAGADIVQMLQQELENKELRIDIRLARPSRLFVFFEKDAPVPEWLEREFRRLPVELRLSPDAPQVARKLGREPRYAVRFEVWTRDVLEAGKATLSAVDKRDENSPPFYMYGVAAKSLTDFEKEKHSGESK
ncbi:MAG: FecR domain-containing protein, partial [Planctomycetota bacterium]